MPPSEEKPSFLVAAVLIVAGLVILAPSGLYTGAVVGTAILDGLYPGTVSPKMGFVLTVLIVGTPFIFFGAGLLWMGIKRMRARRQLQDA